MERNFDESPLPFLETTIQPSHGSMSILYSGSNTLEVPSIARASSARSLVSETNTDNATRRHEKVGVKMKRRLSAGLSKISLFRSSS
jgi:hypothetical protein